jgi:hypothetical protein
MPERDWQRDWELCENKIEAVWAFYRLRRDPYDDRKPWAELSDFFAFAREALPYWLQRVRELEADIAWLLQEYGESEELMSEDAVELKERCRVLKERDELRERVAKLEAVAEAARLLLSTCDLVECFPKDDRFSRCHRDDCPMERLEKALATLDEEGCYSARAALPDSGTTGGSRNLLQTRDVVPLNVGVNMPRRGNVLGSG